MCINTCGRTKLYMLVKATSALKAELKHINKNIENQIDKSSLTNLSFKTNSKQVSELNSYCKRNNEKISEVIRKALDIYIDNFAMKLKKKKQ